MIDLLAITLGLALYVFIGALITGITRPLWEPKNASASNRFLITVSLLWPMVVILCLLVMYFMIVVGLPMKAAAYATSRRKTEPAVPTVGR